MRKPDRAAVRGGQRLWRLLRKITFFMRSGCLESLARL